MDVTENDRKLPGDAPGEEGAGVAAPPPPAPPPGGCEALPPLCNTGGNSSNAEREDPKGATPAKLALGWLKIRHTRKSYEVWSYYRVLLKLAEGAELCQASKQHRAFGVRFHWGGHEYWGYPVRREDPEGAAEQGEPGEYLLKLTPAEVVKLEDAGIRARTPDGDSVLTEWGDEALVRLDGYLADAGGMSVLSLLAALCETGATVTRLDISADFAATVIDPVVASMEAKDYSPMRVHEFRDSRGLGPLGGRTCYFGRRGADGGGVYVRFYEKGAEQGLIGVDLLRYEAEFTGHKAQEAASLLVRAPKEWVPVGASIMAGAIDFREGYGQARGTANAARDCPQAAWWVLLLARLAEGVKLQRAKLPDPTLVSMRKWIERSVGRPAAMLLAAMGQDRFKGWLRGILEKGADCMSERDLAMIRDAQGCDVPF